MQLAKTLFRTSFRRRLALAFVLVAGLSAGMLAVGASAAVTSYRHQAFEDRARIDAQQDLALWDPAEPPQVLIDRLEAFERPNDPAVVVVTTDGEELSSIQRLAAGDIPSGMRLHTRGAAGQLVVESTTVGGEPHLIVGKVLEPRATEVYFFHSKSELVRGLEELRVTLLVGWVMVTAVAAVAGTLVARRTLRPVSRAAAAARSVAEGLLDTRLPVHGTDEFAQWSDAFNEMVGALENKLAALAQARDRERRLTADVAHELRTPLGSLMAAATHLEERGEELPPGARRAVELVADGARRLHRLVEELFELHTMEAGDGIVDWEWVDVTELVQRVLHAHGWDDEVRVEGDVAPIVSDRWRLDRIIGNLVANALRHGAPPVIVGVGRDADDVVVSVTDHGDGIPARDLERVFDRYFKVSTARTSASDSAASAGTGLGLAIARQTAALLGGSLQVRLDGSATVFTLRLPARQAAPAVAES